MNAGGKEHGGVGEQDGGELCSRNELHRIWHPTPSDDDDERLGDDDDFQPLEEVGRAAGREQSRTKEGDSSTRVSHDSGCLTTCRVVQGTVAKRNSEGVHA